MAKKQVMTMTPKEYNSTSSKGRQFYSRASSRKDVKRLSRGFALPTCMAGSSLTLPCCSPPSRWAGLQDSFLNGLCLGVVGNPPRGGSLCSDREQQLLTRKWNVHPGISPDNMWLCFQRANWPEASKVHARMWRARRDCWLKGLLKKLLLSI